MATTKRIGDADFAHLQTLEPIFRRLVFSHYNSSACASSDLDRLQAFYKRHTGQDYRLNRACATCLGTFLTMIGRWYFQEKDLREAEQNAETAPAEQEPPKKAAKAPKSAAKKKNG